MRKRGLYYKLVESQEQSSSQIDCKDHNHQLNIDKNDDSNTNLPQLETGVVTIQSSESINNHDQSDEKQFKETDISIWTLLQLNQPEWKYIAFGIIGSAIMGLNAPVYGIIYGEVLGLFDHSLQKDVHRLNNMYALVISNYLVAFYMTKCLIFCSDFLRSRVCYRNWRFLTNVYVYSRRR